MLPLEETNAEDAVGDFPEELGAPRAANWLWNPWYAKLWWTGMSIYWAGSFASNWIADLNELYSSALAGLLNVAFFPPIAMMLLGLGFAREWLASTGWNPVEPSHEEMVPRRSVGGLHDHNSDPLDPKSGMLHWRHFHPDN